MTESTTFPAGVLPPPAVRPRNPPNMISQVPMLPLVVAAAPKAFDAPAGNPFATSLNPVPPPRPPSHKASGGFRRFVSWFLLLAALGGIAFAAYTYGPELLDRVSDETLDEPDAPLAFPTVAVAAAPVRTATYTVEHTGVEGDDVQPTDVHEITTDFETGLTRTMIDRNDRADVEMLAVFDGAVMRRVDEPTWYQIERGDFPVDTTLGRTRWVRTIDELLPAPIRAATTIVRSTESVVGSVPTRHLLLSIDPTTLASIITPGVDAAGVTTPPAATFPAGITFDVDTDRAVPIEFEVWIDDTGLVRKVQLPASLGGETITVTSVSPEAFQPVFPTADVIRPLTAGSLLALGF